MAAELRGALPSAGFGLVAAGLLVFPVAAGVRGLEGANTGALLASLPLALSMGAAEWLLVWYRAAHPAAAAAPCGNCMRSPSGPGWCCSPRCCSTWRPPPC